MAGWQDDPIVSAAPAAKGGAGWQNDPIVGATAQASDNDYSNSPLSAVARTFESSADWGTGDLLRAAVTGKKPSETAAQSSAAAASLPWYVRYPTEVAGYGAGIVNLLDPYTDAVELGAAGLMGGRGIVSAMAKTAAEGATVGGVSHVAGSDDPGITDTAGAAIGGGVLGGAAGAAAPLINKGLTKTLGTRASIDPAAATTATEGIKTAKYADLHAPTAPTFDPSALSKAYVDSINALTDVQRGDVSADFMKKMQQHVNQMQQTGPVSAGAVDEYARSLQNIASPSNNAEQILAAKVRDALTGENGVLATAQPVSNHPIGQAYGMLNDAKAANTQFQMAQNLADWNERAANKGSLGDAPFNEAKNWYNPGTPEYDALMKLYSQSQNQYDPSWGLGHLAAGAIGDLGGAMFGFGGHLAGEALAYLGLKPAIKSIFKGKKQNALQKNIQQAYPTLTGQPLTGAQTGPQLPQGAGDAIKNLMLGMGAS